MTEWYAICETHGILSHSENAEFMENIARIHKKHNTECMVFIGYEVAVKRGEG
jgi:hypothetical protein